MNSPGYFLREMLSFQFLLVYVCAVKYFELMLIYVRGYIMVSLEQEHLNS